MGNERRRLATRGFLEGLRVSIRFGPAEDVRQQHDGVGGDAGVAPRTGGPVLDGFGEFGRLADESAKFGVSRAREGVFYVPADSDVSFGDGWLTLSGTEMGVGS